MVARRLRAVQRCEVQIMTLLFDGASYHLRAWPDDGETFEFRAVGPGGAGVLVNLTDPGEANNLWVRADGSIWTTDGHRVFDIDDVVPGPDAAAYHRPIIAHPDWPPTP
jgi:hypothetical protein